MLDYICRSLRLQGHLSPLPNWVATLTNLRKIYLSWTELVQDDLRVLGTLPNLMRLQLDMKSYIEEKMLFDSGAFSILRMLQLYRLEGLKGVAFEKGASPKMERITIEFCEFTSGITGITNLPNLQQISLETKAKVAKLDKLQSEMDAHSNHPVLKMWMSRSEHDHWDREVSEAKEHSTRPPFYEVGQSSQSGAGAESMDNPTTKLLMFLCNKFAPVPGISTILITHHLAYYISTCLQTLDIRNTSIKELPLEVTKLQSLSCLRCANYSDDFSFGVGVPKGIGKLKCLQILKVVNIKGSGLGIVKELDELTQLKKLCLVGVSETQGKELSAALHKLPYLRSLGLYSNSIPTLPLQLQSLKLMGRLSPLPSWVAALTNLRKIYLSCTSLVEDDLRELGKLPNLVLLHLGMMSYIREKLLFGTGAFPILRMLRLDFLYDARGVAFNVGASPKMERITIRRSRFTSGITGIGNLPKLQEITLEYSAKVAKLDSLEREMKAHPNHPVLTMRMSRSKHDLGDEEVSEAKEQSTRPPFHEVEQSSQSGAGPESMDI
ncbi:hypothetical protein GUJ93_ZPchr0006g44798 [Zizania palustris]|uniref:Disease resistance R13L4/SHOC-2-like LRR domain-containing protein n=1 Tax=Zizania palustris TaxID=103762 RepID=A0A8J5SVC6_ZIZPA|nr:hypothetical protein GUJ93_ZPchr0006g44798 [Zizania palustris]